MKEKKKKKKKSKIREQRTNTAIIPHKPITQKKKEMNNLRDKILRLWLFHDCWIKANPFFLIFNVDFRRHCNDTSVSHFVAF